jgi:hypothetical protein
MQSDAVRSYHRFFEAREKPHLYTAPWWLDATCGIGGWDAVFKKKQDHSVIAALAFHKTRIRGLSAVITPPLTQWVSLISSSGDSGVSYQSLLTDLPKSAILDLSIKPDTELLYQNTNLPVALQYSFIIPGMETMDTVRGKYNEGLKRNLRQAEKNYVLQKSDDVAGFLTLCEQTYLQRKMKPPHWFNKVVPDVYQQLIELNCGSITIAKAEGKVIAGVLTAWDRHSGYYLAGGRTGDEQGASAHALLLDHAVHAAQTRGIAFDFEGSMHPGIANFFQSFGGVPVSYWQVRKFTGIGKLWALFH